MIVKLLASIRVHFLAVSKKRFQNSELMFYINITLVWNTNNISKILKYLISVFYVSCNFYEWTWYHRCIYTIEVAIITLHLATRLLFSGNCRKLHQIWCSKWIFFSNVMQVCVIIHMMQPCNVQLLEYYSLKNFHWRNGHLLGANRWCKSKVASLKTTTVLCRKQENISTLLINVLYQYKGSMEH